MSRRDKLLALAERVEALTGPDREVDAATVRALYPQAIVEIYCVGDEEPLVFHAQPLVQNKRELPAYTASLDAAMSLVPDAWNFKIHKTGKFYWVEVWKAASSYARTSPDPALAMTAAALRALAEQQP